MTEELDEIVRDIDSDPSVDEKGNRGEKMLYVYGKHPGLPLRSGPEIDYVWSKSEKIPTCKHFEVDLQSDDPLKRYCNEGRRTATLCHGTEMERCGWYQTREFVDRLKEELDGEELTTYYRVWLGDISKNYTPARITAHLEKHLGEDRNSHGWYVSAKNLLEIYGGVEGADKGKGAYRELKGAVVGYGKPITVSEQLERLLRHFRGYSASTPSPLTEAAVEHLKTELKSLRELDEGE